jgi:hypothetical protein
MPRRADDARRQLLMGGACRRQWAKAHNGRSLRRTWRHDWAPRARSETRAAVRLACGAKTRGGGAGLPGLGRRNWWHHGCGRWLQEATRTPWTTIHLIFVFSCNDRYFCWEINTGQLQQISCDGRYFYWFHCSKKMQFLFLQLLQCCLCSERTGDTEEEPRKKAEAGYLFVASFTRPSWPSHSRDVFTFLFWTRLKLLGRNFPYMGARAGYD